jgi:transglutaminase-like putative cysteine protease
LSRTLILLAAIAALAGAAWWQIIDAPVDLVALGRTIGLALVPALVILVLRHRSGWKLAPAWLIGLAVLLLGLIPAAGYAMGVPVTHMRRGELDFWGPLFDAVDHGFSDFYDTRVPFDPAEHVEMTGLVLMAVYLTVGIAGVLLAAGRPLASAVALLLGVGWPATLAATIPGRQPLWAGAVLVVAVLLFLLLTREGRRPLRRLGTAIAFGAVLVLAAVGASTTSAVAKNEFLAWQGWNYDPEPDPVSVRYVWQSNYTGIKFSEEPTVLLRIQAPKRNLYWRATTLDEYTGVVWREDLDTGPPVRARRVTTPEDDPLVPEAAYDEENWTRQEVTVEALADTHVIGAAVPMRIDLGAPRSTQYSAGGIVLVEGGLEYQQRYVVQSYAPRVDTQALAELPGRYPEGLDRFLEVIPDVQFPAFRAPQRDELVRQLFARRSFDELLAAYEPLYRQALEVIEGAQRPYVAVAALEAWFRSEGGFVYDEQPPPYGSEPPLVTFVLDHKAGYCQQYAGAMALMLRLLGIPARVAAGFTSGEYDDRRKEWVVTNHNAHTWVEVWFPEYGWLPFDPTPGRGTLAGSYSTSSATFGTGDEFPRVFGPSGVAPEALAQLMRQRLSGAAAGQGSTTPGGIGPVAPSSVEGGDGLGIAGLVFLILGCALGLLLAVKEVRRRLRFAGRDPRHLASACRRDLQGFLADQRVTFSPSATLEDVGDYVEQRYRVNAGPFVRASAAARFGPPGSSSEAGKRARRELRGLLRQIRRQTSLPRRFRGALNVRSLAV